MRKAGREGEPPPLPEPLSAPALDSHCHLDLMDVDVATAVEQAAAVGINRMVTVGIDVPTSQWQVDTAVAHDSVYAAVAVHPNEVVNAAEDAWDGIDTLAKHPKVFPPLVKVEPLARLLKVPAIADAEVLLITVSTVPVVSVPAPRSAKVNCALLIVTPLATT